MTESIFLIDGMYLLFSSFYSNRNIRTLKGEPTGALFGFITRIEALLRDEKPDRIAVAFDSKEKTFRHLMFEPYKAKRQAPPEELIQQIPWVREYLELRGIHLFEIPGFEADDIIAYCSKWEAQKENNVFIFSADKDLFQLVGNHIYVYHPKTKQKLDPEGVKEFFGILPHQVVDYLSLTGDTSDNIPGVPGIGEKTAIKIIEKFTTIDNLLNNLDQLDEKNRNRIRDNMELLEISRKLIDFKLVPEIPSGPIEPRQFKDEIKPELLDFFRRFSFNSLLKRFEEAPTLIEKTDTPSTLDIRYHIVKTPAELIELKDKIIKEKYFAFDLETTALEFFKADIVGVSISFKEEGYYIPLRVSKTQAETHGISITLEDFKSHLSDAFKNPEIRKIGHNLKFDILNLNFHGIDVQGAADDSMIMSYLLHPNRRTHGLKDLTFELLNYKQTGYEELTGKGKTQKLLIDVDVETVGRYCIDDSYLSLKLVEILDPSIKEKELTKLYCNIEMPLIKVLTDMERVGVKIDVGFLKKSARILEDKIIALEQEIYDIAGVRFNLNSTQQLGELLFEKMGLPTQKKTQKTKSYSTDIEVLNELKSYPIVAKIIDYRTYKKLLSTYLVGLLETVDSNNRVHTSYNQTVTATGRLSSSDPNLQNIPVGETEGINVRDAFIAEEGKFIMAADYSQIELRVMAHFSQDPNLMEAFEKDFDIHQHTADTVFGGDLFATAQEKRKRAKIINFSVLYGTGPFSLSKELGVSYKDAKSFIDMYFEKYSGVKRFIEDVISQAEKEPEVKTISGRRRDIPEITSSNRTVKENGNRIAINTVIQGSAADIIKVAMIRISQQLEKLNLQSKLVMQVHDELVFEYPPEEEEVLFKMVKYEMENAIPLRVPVKVKIEKGNNWGKLTKV